MKAYLAGSFPRHEELIKAFRDHAKNKISTQHLRYQIELHTREVVEIQHKNKLSYIVDGMLTWDDLLRPFASSLEKVEINGLARWFDNNFFYKIPVIKGELRLRGGFDKSFDFTHMIPRGKRKIILPDPFSFAALSENQFYRSFEELVFDVSDSLAAFVNELGTFEQIQLTAPNLVFHKASEKDVQVFSQAIASFRTKAAGELLLHFPYGSGSSIIEDVIELPVDVIGFDMYKISVDSIKAIDGRKAIYLGVVDGRNTLLEKPEHIISIITKVEKIARPSEIHFGPNCELAHLPYPYAVMKVNLIGEVYAQVTGVG
uniref:Cobalamin-independent methionine synthase MetE N-terminal domain-containing protein n=1 Tax=Caldiarchaeum subterraneum TaxID=311458 RepID=A0A7C5YB67_CALS0